MGLATVTSVSEAAVMTYWSQGHRPEVNLL